MVMPVVVCQIFFIGTDVITTYNYASIKNLLCICYNYGEQIVLPIQHSLSRQILWKSYYNLSLVHA